MQAPRDGVAAEHGAQARGDVLPGRRDDRGFHHRDTPDSRGVAPGRSQLGSASAAVLLAVGYYAAARLGVALRVPGAGIAAMWPASAILLAAVLTAPRRLWPSFALAIVPAHLLAQLPAGVPPWWSALQLQHNVVLCFGIALALGRAERRPLRFDDPRQVAWFLVLGVAAGPMLAALLAPSVLVAAVHGGEAPAWEEWGRASLSTAVAVLTLVPALVLALSRPPRWLPRYSVARAVEAALLAAALVAVGRATFARPAGAPEPSIALLYAPIPFLLWAAARFRVAGAAATLVALSGIATWSARGARGPFTGGGLAENVVDVQLFLIAVAVPLLLVASLIEERRRTAWALRTSERRAREQVTQLAAVYRSAPVALGFMDRDLRFARVNERLADFDGVAAPEHVGRTLRQVTPEVADVLEPLLREVLATGAAIVDREVRGASGPEERVWRGSYYPVRDVQGEVVGVNCVLQDVTQRLRREAENRELLRGLRESFERIQDLAGRLIEAQEGERSRVARELHDDVNQQVAALAIGLSGLKRRLPPSAAALHADVAHLQQRASDLADAIRRVCRDLHPALLQHAGVVAALRTLCREVGQRHGVEVSFDGPEELAPPPPDVSLCMYRVAQEALRNATRHAAASRIVVALRAVDGALELTIADDGRGIDLAAARGRGGLGLVSLEERIRLVGGALSIDARPGGGTELCAHIPAGGRHGTDQGPARG